MMRKQGSLYLASLVCDALSSQLSERAASSRLTLALRHYERALRPERLSHGAQHGASASPAMERCAAEVGSACAAGQTQNKHPSQGSDR